MTTLRPRFGVRPLTAILVGMALLLLAGGAGAAPDAGGAGGAGTDRGDAATSLSGRERAAKVAEARRSFSSGLKLYDEGKFREARDAFQHAYDLAPSYRLLYNMGLATKELGDHAGAIRMLEGYLAEGMWEINAERGAEVAATIGELMLRVGTSKVTTNVPGAQLFVDGVFAGQTPLEEPLVLNPGQHTVEARAKGYVSASRAVTATPGEAGEPIHLELTQPPAASSPVLPVVIGVLVVGGVAVVALRRRRPAA